MIDGGQSMNPSAEDFIKAFDTLDADTIFAFPNNGNIIMAANQAASLYDKADVRVLPSKTIGEGYSAISMMDVSSGDTDAIIAEAEEVMSGVVTGFISRASRDAEMNGVKVRKDDYIGFVGDAILADRESRADAATALVASVEPSKYDVALLICGAGVPEDEAKALYDSFSAEYKRCEFIMIDGGQPVYDYIIIFE